MDNSEKKSSLSEMLRHPMANMIVGFFLTTVVGAGVTNYYSMKQREQKLHEEMVETNKKTVALLASLNAERLAQAEMLLTELEDGNEENSKKLIAMYKETKLRWKKETTPALMAARQVLPKEKYYRFRDYMENEYRTRFLTTIGKCLNQAADAVEDGKPVGDLLKSCRVREYLKQAGRCNTALLDTLYEMAKGTIDDYDAGQLVEQKAVHKKAIRLACAPLATKSGH